MCVPQHACKGQRTTLWYHFYVYFKNQTHLSGIHAIMLLMESSGCMPIIYNFPTLFELNIAL